MLFCKGTDNDISLVEVLKNEVQNLKSWCNMLEKTVKALQSICDTHERSLETFQLKIVKLHRSQGMLDLSYQKKGLEVMP